MIHSLACNLYLPPPEDFVDGGPSYDLSDLQVYLHGANCAPGSTGPVNVVGISLSPGVLIWIYPGVFVISTSKSWGQVLT